MEEQKQERKMEGHIDAVKQLYDWSKRTGLKGIGEEDDFRRQLANPSNRRKYFDAVSTRYNIGSFDGFNRNLSRYYDALAKSEAVLQQTVMDAARQGYERQQKELKEQIKTQAGDLKEKAKKSKGEAMDRAARRYDEVETERPWWQRVLRAAAESNTPTGTPIVGTHRDAYVANQGDVMAAEAAQKKAEDVLEMADQYERNAEGASFLGNFGHGLWDTVSDMDTWSGEGLYRDSRAVMTAAQKAERGEPLTEQEDMLLTALGLQAAAQEQYGDDLGRGYRVGEIAGNMAPFAAQFAFNPASKMGQSVMKAAARYAAKKFGTKGVQNLVKYGARVGGDVAGATLMATTSGAGRTAQDATQRRMGHARYATDENGAVRYDGAEGGESAGAAFGKALKANTIENFSEMMGNYFPAIGKLIGKSKPAEWLKATRVGKWADEMSASDFARSVADMERFAGWNGIGAEILEEEGNILLNAFFVGDNQVSDLWDRDQQLDIILGMAMTGGLISAARTGAYVGARYSANKKYNQANAEAERVIGEPWQGLKEEIDQSPLEQREAILKGMQENSDLSPEQIGVVIEYARRRTTLEGVQRMRDKQLAEGEKSPVDAGLEDARLQGRQAADGDGLAKHIAKVELDGAAARLTPQQRAEADAAQNVGDYLMAHPDQMETLEPYFRAKAKYEGLMDGVRETVEGQVQQAVQSAEQLIHSDGNVYSATLKADDAAVNILSGRVVMTPEGTLDREKSDKRFIVIHNQGRHMEMRPIEDIYEVSGVQEGEAYKEAMANDVRQKAAEREAAQIDGVRDFAPGEQFTVLAEGKPVQMEVVAQNQDGTVTVTDGETQSVMPREALQKAVNEAEVYAQVEALEHRKGAGQEGDGKYGIDTEVMLNTPEGVVRGHIVSTPDADGLMQVMTDTPVNGNRVNVYTAEQLDDMVVPEGMETVSGNRNARLGVETNVTAAQEEGLQPIGENRWGKVYKWTVGKAKEAAAFLRKLQGGYLKGVFHRNDLGSIDLAWGNEKGGLKHIIQKHIVENDDFDSVDEAMQVINDVIANGELTLQKGGAKIEKDGYRVVLAKDENNNWVVTAYDYSRMPEDKKRSENQSRVLSLSTMDTENGAAQGGSAQTGITLDDKGTQTRKESQVPVDENNQQVYGRLTEEEAKEIVSRMEESAEVAPEMELTIENWDAEFGEDGVVNTPIGEVKMGENQFTKLMRQGREGKLGMVKPTLENPDVIIEDSSEAKEGDTTERGSSYVFVKAFVKSDGSRYYYFTSVTVSKDGREVVISNQEKRRNVLTNLLMKGKLIWKHADDVSTASDVADGLYSSQGKMSDPTTEGTVAPQTDPVSSTDKNTVPEEESQEGKKEKVDKQPHLLPKELRQAYESGEKDAITKAEKALRDYVEGSKDLKLIASTYLQSKDRIRGRKDKESPEYKVQAFIEKTCKDALMNSGIPVQAFQAARVRRDLAAETENPDVLDVLSVDPDYEVLLAVIHNPKTREATLRGFTGRFSNNSLDYEAQQAIAQREENNRRAFVAPERNDGESLMDYAERVDKAKQEYDKQGRPTREQETIREDTQNNSKEVSVDRRTDKIGSIDELTDEDFTTPSRNVELPTLPQNVADAIGTQGKPVVIKKSIFEKNRNTHPELTPTQSRDILHNALYKATFVGQSQPVKRPNYWVAVQTADKNSITVLDVNRNKENVEIVGWRRIDAKGLAKLKRQAEREGGQFLILTSEDAAAALSALPSGSSYIDKGSEKKPEDQAPAAEKIGDVGEKIGGARKDRMREYAEREKKAQNNPNEVMEDLRSLPVSKIFNFDYGKLRKEGVSNEIITLLQVIRSIIPSKPRTDYKLKRWVSEVFELYQASLRLVALPESEQKELLNKILEIRGIRGMHAARMALGGFDGGHQIDKAGLEELGDSAGHYDKEGKWVSIKGQWYVTNAGKHGGIYPTREKAEEALRAFAGENTLEQKGEKKMQFSVYQRRSDGSAYITVKGKPSIIVADGFKRGKDALEYVKEHYDELEASYRGMKDRTEIAFREQRPRKGRDWRSGRDISAEEFRDTFGFRGVEFGNWTNQKDRQAALNKAYDALMDLAEAVGKSPRSLSLNGELGMAFGARGGGKASAHYEAEKVVINLTKTKGAGTLAHEWWHALDNYFSRRRGRKNDFNTSRGGYVYNRERGGAYSPQEREEVTRSFAELVRAIEKSGYGERSHRYASLKSDYWSRPTELGARAFAVWVERKLSEKGTSNDFLATNPVSSDWGDPEMVSKYYPYPIEGDFETLDTAFDNLFNAIEEKVDERTGNSVLQQRIGDKAPLTEEERALRDAMVGRLRESGIEVITDVDAGQRILDEANGKDVWLNAEQKRALETAFVSMDETSSTVVSSADGARMRKEEEEAIREDEKVREHRVYHGSGAEFERFDHSHMGEGEGSQAYGWGSYVTEAEGIGWTYAQKGKKPGEGASGYVYTVEIPDKKESNYLEWEKEVEDAERDRVIEALSELDPSEADVDYFLDKLEEYENAYTLTGGGLYRLLDKYAFNSDRKASEFLLGMGYKGVSVPAQYTSGGRKDGARNYVIFNESDLKIVDRVRFFRTASGQAYGFTVGGKIYIDPYVATAETPLHEYTHLWASALRKGNAREWKNVVELMKGTPVWDEVKRKYPELKTEEEIADEVLATYSGQRGAERLREKQRKIAESGASVMDKAEAISALDRVKEALRRFWRGVADFLHIHYTTAEQVADRVLYDLLDGVNPSVGAVYPENDAIRYQIREGDAPKNVGIGYKVFVLKNGRLYPPMVANPGGEYTPVGVWLDADAAPIAGRSKTGRNQVKAGGKGTQGGSGKLAYRPGWHLGEIPYALQFNRIGESGNKELFPANFVWAEVEYANDVDYQDEAMSYGKNANGKFQHSLAGLPRVPENGSYRYRTNPNPETDPWIITGAMRVKKILTPSEVDTIVKAAGREPQRRQPGAITDEQIKKLNAEYGLADEVLYRASDEIEESNKRFNEQLQRQIDGTLPKGHVYELGMPSEALLSAGIPDLPIEMAASQLAYKSSSGKHDFDLSEVMDLPNAIANPIAVFEYGDKSKAQNILTILKHNGDHFLVGMFVRPTVKGHVLEVNSIRNVFPKNGLNIVRWVADGKLTYANKEELLNFLDQQRTNYADVAFVLPDEQVKQEKTEVPNSAVKSKSKQRSNSADVRKLFSHAAKIVEEFENPKQEEGNIDTFYRSVYGGNSGYVGYSKSVRAVDAESRGLRNKSQMDKPFADRVNEILSENGEDTRVTVSQIKRDVDTIEADEWHHTSMYGNRTNYYSPESVARHYSQDKLSGYTRRKEEAERRMLAQQAREQSARSEYAEYRRKEMEKRVSLPYETRKGLRVEGTAGMFDMQVYDGEERLSKRHRKAERDEAIEEVREKVREAEKEIPSYEQWLGERHPDIAWEVENRERRRDERSIPEPQASNQDVKAMYRTEVRRMAEDLHVPVEFVTQESLPQGHKGAKGYYNPRTGKIAIVVENHTSVEDVRRTVFHEAVAHYGLRNLFGERFNEFLDKAYAGASKAVREKIVEMSKKHGWNIRTATEEYLAELAERGFEQREEKTFWDKVKDLFRGMFREMKKALGFRLTDNDLRYVLWKSYQKLRGDGGILSRAEDVVMRNRFGIGQSERERIAAQARQKGTYRKAPNGKRSRLTGEQWVTVRTEAFKRWFGDWEKAIRIEKLRKSKPIVVSGEDYKGKYELNSRSAGDYIIGSMRGKYVNKDTGDVIKITRSSQKVAHHDAESMVHLKSIAYIPQMIENAIFITEEPNTKTNTGFDSYRYYVVGMKMGGVDYTIKLVVGVKDGESYYDHALTEIEKNNLLDLTDGVKADVSDKEEMISSIKDKRLISILQTDASKIVDENGEPRALYLLEGNTPLSGGMIPLRREAAKGTNAVFLNVRRPAVNPKHEDAQIDKLTEAGHDGIIREKDGEVEEIMVFYPQQVRGVQQAGENESIPYREVEGSIEQTNRRFNELLEELTEENADELVLDLGTPSPTLRVAGVEDKPMKLYGNKVIKKMKKHGFALDELRDLPRAVADPIAVFKNYGKEGNRSVLTELKTGQGNFLVTLTLGKGHDVDFNIVTSVFGKGESNIVDWIKNGFATYINKEKTLDYLHFSGRSIPEASNNREKENAQEFLHHSALKAVTSDNRELSTVTKIVKDFENPRIEDENPMILYRDDTPMIMGSARGEYERRAEKHYRDNLATRVLGNREAWQDYMLGLKDLQQAVEKASGPIKDYEDAYTAENQRTSIDKAEKEFYRRNYFDPLMKAVASLVDKGKTYEEITRYMMAKHGLERNRVFALRDAKGQVKAERETLEKSLKDGEITQEKYDKEKKKLDRKEKEYYQENRKRDYSGLTELTVDEIAGREGMEMNIPNMEAVALEMVEKFEQGNEQEVEELWKRVNAATKKTLKTSMESGVISKGVYDEIRSMFAYYVPLRGWNDRTAGDMYEYLRSRQSSGGATVRRAAGRESQAEDPIATIGMMADRAISEGNKNKVKQRFLNLALNRPSDLFTVRNVWYVKDEGANVWERSLPDIPAEATAEEVARIVEDHEALMKRLAEKGLARKSKNGLDIRYRHTDSQEQEHAVVVRQGGKEYVVYVNGNPRAAQALNGLTLNQWGDVTKGVRAVTRFMSANMTSRNPTFVMRNLMRDVLFSATAVYIKEDGKYTGRYYRNLVTVMPAIMRGVSGKENLNKAVDRYFKEFLENGGETGYTAYNTLEDYRKEIKRKIRNAKVKNGVESLTIGGARAVEGLVYGIEWMNRVAEDMSRFAVFMTSRQSGRSIQRSISDAKEVTVNFNRKGGGRGFLPSVFQTSYMFFNVSVQSAQNLWNLAKANPWKAAKAFGFHVAMGYLQGLLNDMLLSGDDDPDKYANLPDYIRQNSLCIYLGDDYFLTISLSPEQRPAYSLGESMYQATLGRGRGRGFKGVLRGAVGSFAELLPINPLQGTSEDRWWNWDVWVPDMVAPVYEVAVNRNFFGSPIYKDNSFNKYDPQYTKAYAGTSKWLVRSSELLNEATGGDRYRRGWLDLNPAAFDHLLDQYFGGVLKTAKQTINSMQAIFDPQMRQARNYPVVSGFMYQSGERDADRLLNEAYYRLKREAQETERILSGYRKETHKGSLEYAEKLDSLYRSPQVMRMEYFKGYEGAIDQAEEVLKQLDGEDKEQVKSLLRMMKDELLQRTDDVDRRYEQERRKAVNE